MTKAEYEHRLVLFLDILGFKEIITDTDNGKTKLSFVINAIDRIGELSRDAGLHETQQVTQFSDSIVVSYETSDPSAVFWLVNSLGYCLVDLTYAGVLVRGAITAGKLIHTPEYLFGPAMIKAYELESKVAKYPRVLIDRDVLNVARMSHANHHDADDEENYVKAFLRLDLDGYYFIDYVSWRAVVETIGADFDSYCPYMERLSQIIRTGLRSDNKRVRDKYVWLHKLYLKEIESFAATPENFPGRANNPEIHEFIARLPRFDEEASAFLDYTLA